MANRVYFYKVFGMHIQTGIVYSESNICGKIYMPIYSADAHLIDAIKKKFSLYFLVKGIYFMIAKLDKLENFVDEWDWISGKKE